jgi:hypothetical protein
MTKLHITAACSIPPSGDNSNSRGVSRERPCLHQVCNLRPERSKTTTPDPIGRRPCTGTNHRSRTSSPATRHRYMAVAAHCSGGASEKPALQAQALCKPHAVPSQHAHFFFPPPEPSSLRSQEITLPNMTTPFPSMKALDGPDHPKPCEHIAVRSREAMPRRGAKPRHNAVVQHRGAVPRCRSSAPHCRQTPRRDRRVSHDQGNLR